MKRLICLFTLIAALIFPSIAKASDISDATYYGRLIISNTGSSTSTGVSTITSIDTDNYIAVGYMDNDLDKVAIQNTAGLDAPFMPGYDGNPWVVHVDTINQNQYLPYRLYSKDATGGHIAYFPGPGGMTVPDNAALEIGNNGKVTWSGYVNASIDGTVWEKDGAINLVTDGTSLKVILYAATSSYTTPSVITNTGDWTNPAYSIDGDTNTYAQKSSATSTWTTPIEFEVGKYCSGIRYWVTDPYSVYSNIRVEYFDGSVWKTFYESSIGTRGNWQVRDGLNDYVEKYRISFYRSGGTGSPWIQLHETGYAAVPVVSSTATTGKHKIDVELDGTYLNLYIDDSLEDTAALAGASVPNNANPWKFYSDAYINYIQIDKSGNPVDRWEWEYSDTFTGSISGIVATPSFRTTSSDPNVSAELLSFGPITEAKAPGYALGEQIDLINITPSATGTFSTAPATGDFPLAGVINAVASATSTPPQLPLTIIAGFAILAVSLLTSALMRRFGSGGILPKSIAIIAVMGIFIAVGNFAIDFWMLIVFIIMAVAIMFASKQIGWS